MKNMLTALVALAILCSVGTSAFAQEMPHTRDIDVIVRKITNDNTNVFSAVIAKKNDGDIQAENFEFTFSTKQKSEINLKLHQITADTEGYDWFVSKLGKLGSKIAPFDLYCVDDNGVRCEFSENISVTIKLPNGYQEPVLYYLDTSGAVQEVSVKWKKGSGSFTVNQSGYYVFADRTDEAAGICYYTITSSAKKGGSITPDGEQIVEAGTDIMFQISAESGYQISNVKVDGKNIEVADSYTFRNVQQDHKIEVKFKKSKGVVKTVIDNVSDWLTGS